MLARVLVWQLGVDADPFADVPEVVVEVLDLADEVDELVAVTVEDEVLLQVTVLLDAPPDVLVEASSPTPSAAGS